MPLLFALFFSALAAAQKVLKEVGAHPVSGAVIKLLDGRYGPYVTDGTTNASLPKDEDPATLTVGRAVDLLASREGKGGKGRPRRGRAKAGSRG